MSLLPLPNPPYDSLCDQVGVLLRSLTLIAADLDKASEDPDTQASQSQIPSKITQLQPQFQALLTALGEADLASSVVGRLRPYQTEGHRRLRLLGVEAMKLQAAKQPETLAKVTLQLQAHLEQLTKFTQAIADEVCQ